MTSPTHGWLDLDLKVPFRNINAKGNLASLSYWYSKMTFCKYFEESLVIKIQLCKNNVCLNVMYTLCHLCYFVCGNVLLFGKKGTILKFKQFLLKVSFSIILWFLTPIPRSLYQDNSLGILQNVAFHKKACQENKLCIQHYKSNLLVDVFLILFPMLPIFSFIFHQAFPLWPTRHSQVQPATCNCIFVKVCCNLQYNRKLALNCNLEGFFFLIPLGDLSDMSPILSDGKMSLPKGSHVLIHFFKVWNIQHI